MSELQVLVRRGGQQYQIRPTVNAPSGERTPAYGVAAGEASWTQPPLTPAAAALVDQLLQADSTGAR